jgi:hypothetical protein
LQWQQAVGNINSCSKATQMQNFEFKSAIPTEMMIKIRKGSSHCFQWQEVINYIMKRGTEKQV